MALQEFWIASFGPFEYDDADVYPDLQTFLALYTSGGGFKTATGQVTTAPVVGEDVVRLDDIGGLLDPTFANVTGSRALNVVYQNTAAGVKQLQIVVTLAP